MGKYVWPVENKKTIAAPFGYRVCRKHGTELHLGIDITTKTTPILAIHAGKITKINTNLENSYGFFIELVKDNIKTRYCHLSQIDVLEGDYVNAGDKIGISGSTGESLDDHLHFEFYVNNIIKDPLLYVTPQDNISNYTGEDDNKVESNTQIIPRDSLSWNEIDLLTSQAVSQTRTDWRTIIDLPITLSAAASDILEQAKTIAAEATYQYNVYLPEGVTDISIDNLVKNYQAMYILLNSYNTIEEEVFIELFSTIYNRFFALLIKKESIEKSISIFDTSVYKSYITELNNESELKILKEQKAAEELSLNNYLNDSENYPGYNKKIITLNNEINTLKSQIISEQYRITSINSNYSIIEKQINYNTNMYNNILRRISSFDDNFSDEYAYWNKNVIESPDTLNFWLEFLDTQGELSHYSIPNIGDRTKVDNESSINSIYFRNIPTIIFYGQEDEDTVVNEKTGYTYINISDWAKDLFTYSTQGISAKDFIDENLYNYVYCIENIQLNTIPIYYLEPNTRIFIYDKQSHIEGEFLINQLTIPMQYNGNMTISATKAQKRLY